jgi:hypothetical protein
VYRRRGDGNERRIRASRGVTLRGDADGVELADILTDGAADRLVLANGGVARDFLSIFRRSIDVARERARAAEEQAAKINAEDVNIASGEYDTSKREEFKRDTANGDQQSLD